MFRPVKTVTALAAFTLLAVTSEAGGAAPRASRQSWREAKCVRYTAAWSAALGRLGRTGLGQDFLAAHDAFLASGCTARADVCPRSSEEFRLANVMVILAMNAGTASTFPPFFCRR